MAIKTFNLDDETYRKFSDYCKENGLSMSKQIEIFIKSQLEERPKVREEYLQRLERIRKGKYIKFNSIERLRKATS
jgi:antitoxin component of RelBE/YafQ-DinJ toxin-antitoxin module